MSNDGGEAGLARLFVDRQGEDESRAAARFGFKRNPAAVCFYNFFIIYNFFINKTLILLMIMKINKIIEIIEIYLLII